LQSVELIECLNPVHTSYATFRRDSGGPGRFRGGLGLARRIEILSKEASLSVVTDRSIIPPFGVLGGQSGHGQHWSVTRNGVEKPISFGGKASNFRLKRGDIVNCLTAGGGGYGDPLDRDPDRVRRDVIDGYVSLESARQVYGVVLKGKDLSVSEKATRDQRRTMRVGRHSFTLGTYRTPRSMKGTKVIMLNREEAGMFSSGDLVEIYHDNCPTPFRARVVFRARVQSKGALIDDETRQMMGLRDGDTIHLMNIEAAPLPGTSSGVKNPHPKGGALNPAPHRGAPNNPST
jgi:N-methylhydantoinase B